MPNELSGSSAHQSLTVRYNSTSSIAYFYRLSTIDSLCHLFPIYRPLVCSLPRCGVFDTGYLRFFDSPILGNKFHHESRLKNILPSWHDKICSWRYTFCRLSECSLFVEVAKRENKRKRVIFSSIYLFSSSKFVINDAAKHSSKRPVFIISGWIRY